MKLKIVRLIGLLLLAVGFLNSCNAVENLSNSASMLVIELLTGTGLDGTDNSTTIFSDVVSDTGSVINDLGKLNLRAYLIDPLNENPTHYQDVIVDQIDVEYSRSDGLNREGKDVPYSFSQKMSAMVPIAEKTELSFVIVRHVAKLESPLVELITWTSQEKILKLEAKITVHSKDVSNHRLAPVSASISVWCANFADTTE